jgi:hypothetical protein
MSYEPNPLQEQLVLDLYDTLQKYDGKVSLTETLGCLDIVRLELFEHQRNELRERMRRAP